MFFRWKEETTRNFGIIIIRTSAEMHGLNTTWLQNYAHILSMYYAHYENVHT